LDTIVACSTPVAHSGIALVRMSGEGALQIIHDLVQKQLKHRQSTFCILQDGESIIDSCLVCIFIGPHSYTGEDTVEISCHGNPVIIEHVIQQCIKRGARPARKGEFTKRAFVNNKLSLLQAESIDALIHSTSLSGVAIAQQGVDGEIDRFITKMQQQILDICAELEARLDYPGDELEYINDDALIEKMTNLVCRVKRYCSSWADTKRKIYGAKVALIGEVNAGKSSLFNMLVGMPRAIVSSIPGTTRDIIEKSVYINGLEICFFDTAGQREHSDDEIEIQGMALGTKIIKEMDAVILVVHPQNTSVQKIKETLTTINKQCLVVFSHSDIYSEKGYINQFITNFKESYYLISSETGNGIDVLKEEIYRVLFHRVSSDQQLITSQRQYDILISLSKYLECTIEVLPDFGPAIAIDELTTCLEKMSEFSGQDIRELILDNLFSRFCIGK
jgi:tRNA modification GTPase